VIDVSNPANPTITGSAVLTDCTAFSQSVSSVKVFGNYAYVGEECGREGRLQIIDVYDPANPSVAASVDTSGWAKGVYVAGNYAYVTGGEGLQVIDVSDPENPNIVGSVDTPGTADDVYVSGNYAYVADGGSGLRVIDVSDPQNPAIVGSVDTPGGAGDVYVSGNYAYVTGDGLQVIDVSDPTNPTILGSAKKGQGDVCVSGNYAYVAGGGSGLQVIDVSEPTTPTIVGSLDTPGCARGVYVSGNYAYVADAYLGLQILRTFDPCTNVTLVDSTTLTATVPAGLPLGTHNLHVVNPSGEGAILHNSFTVTEEIPTTIIIDGCDTGVADEVLSDGSTISDRITDCAAGARNHGKFVSCVAHLTNYLKKGGIINGREKDKIQSCSARAGIP
jgi:hypothetical protein